MINQPENKMDKICNHLIETVKKIDEHKHQIDPASLRKTKNEIRAIVEELKAASVKR